MKLNASVALILFVTGAAIAQPPPSNSYGKVTLINQTSLPGLYVTARAVDYLGDEIDSQLLTVGAGSNTYTLQFAGYGDGVHHWDLYYADSQPYVPNAQGELVGASFVLGGETTIAERKLGTVLANSATEPYPYTFTTIRDNGILDDGKKTLWVTGDTSLTANLFREGIDKVVAVSGGTGSGGGGDASAVNQIAGNAIMTEHKNMTEAIKDYEDQKEGRRLTAEADALEAAADAALADEAMRVELASLIGSPLAAGLGYTYGATPSAPNLAIVMPAAFGGATFNMNPFTEDRLGPTMVWFRSAMTWLVMVTLGLWFWKELHAIIKGLGAANQATGNTVAGTGGQVTAFISAGVITTAIAGLVTAIMAWSFEGVAVSTFTSYASTNPLVSLSSGVYWFLDKCFPVTLMVSALVARLAFTAFAAKLYAGVCTTIRFATN